MEAEQREGNKKADWWHAAKFGMFIHWGLYALPAGFWNGESVDGIGEWIQQNGRVSVADYAALAQEFNPTRFDADGWVSLAKRAGMQYLIITAKHHDGFAMFGTKASSFNSVDAAPFGRDPLKELADACREQGIRFGLYYSQAQDWHHPGGASRTGHWDPAQDGDMTAYIRDIAVPQVRELLTEYGPISVLFWDTPFEITPEQAGMLAPLLQLQPEMLTNDRLGGGFGGDIETPEQFVPAAGSPGRRWEVCMTMNETWGFRSDDHGWKPAREMLHTLIDIVSKGGNYLLNVGPDASGAIPEPSVERLEEIGRWMQVNGEAITGTTASPFRRQLPWGRCTQKPGRLYLTVFEEPKGGRLSVPIRNTARRAYLLSEPEKPLRMTGRTDSLDVHLSAESEALLPRVVVVEIEGPAQPGLLPPLSQEADGTIRLTAENADFVEADIRADRPGSVRWQVQVTQPGEFTATLAYATDPNTDDRGYALAADGLPPLLSEPGPWAMQKRVSFGTLRLSAAGTVGFFLTPRSESRMAVLGVREMTLDLVSRE